MVDFVIFLGAGASRADGAPLQATLFEDYFSSPASRHSEPMNMALEKFFAEMFSIDVKRRGATFPTFEEALGLCDLAILRKERFRKFPIDGDDQSLRAMSRHLVFLMARILKHKLKQPGEFHRQLVAKLGEGGFLARTAFISTNYDIVIDNALMEMRETSGLDVDYGVDFWNFGRSGDWERPDPQRSIALLKPHGSLNWLMCATCNELRLTPKDKAVERLARNISEYAHMRCMHCNSMYSPLIVPPTFYKDLGNVFLSSIWNKAEILLREAKHIVFCGYSFPDADMHLKYLLKRIQTNRSSKLKISVVNRHKGKKPNVTKEEMARFDRFFGKGVNHTKLSFSDFARNPGPVLKPRRLS